MTILWYALRSDLSEQTEETFERFLLENAEDDLRAETLAHTKARKFITKIKTILDTGDFSDFYKYSGHNKAFFGPCIEVDDIKYIFLSKDISDATVFIDTEDKEDIVYVSILNTPNKITLPDIVKIIMKTNIKSSIIHELIHRQDLKRYNTDTNEIKTNREYYNQPLEFNAHFIEVQHYFRKYIKDQFNKINLNDKHDKTLKQNVINTIIKEIKKAKDGKDCMLSDDLIDYVYSLDSDRYVKLMKRLAEIIEYEYDRFNNKKYVQKYKKPRIKRNWEE